MPETFGLIGWPLSHSLSPRIFELLGERYVLRPAETLSPEVWRDLAGFNVTIPHKQNVMGFLKDLSPEAAAIGAVNCVHQGRGYNTDAPGFADALLETGYRARRARIYGKGGGARAVFYALEELGVEIVTEGPADLHINATPLGMKGFPDASPTDELPGCKLAFDLVYGRVTPFMRLAPWAVDGSAMLVYQALRAWEIWRGQSLTSERRRALKNDIIGKLWPFAS